MAYAENTTVSPDRSQQEIRKILQKHNATSFAFGESAGTATVIFEMSGRRIKFILPLPQQPKDAWKKMSQETMAKKIRVKWRALVLTIKAKLEAVDSGITTIEQEFMAHIVLPNGMTVGEVVIPEIESSYRDRTMPLLLGMQQ